MQILLYFAQTDKRDEVVLPGAPTVQDVLHHVHLQYGLAPGSVRLCRGDAPLDELARPLQSYYPEGAQICVDVVPAVVPDPAMLAKLTDMGFDQAFSAQALANTNNNLDRAVEYVVGGGLVRPPPQGGSGFLTVPGAGGGGGGLEDALSNVNNFEELDGAQAQMRDNDIEAEANEAELLAALRNVPNLTQIRQLFASDPRAAVAELNEVDDRIPSMVDRCEPLFASVMADGLPPATPVPQELEGLMPESPGMRAVPLSPEAFTPQDHHNVDGLVQMGFSAHDAMQAYLRCQGNVQEAANSLIGGA